MEEKMKKYLFSMVMATFLLVSCATQQERVERREQTRTAITEAVSKRRLHIDVSWMNTLKFGSKMVSSDFFLELRGDTLQSYLPYMGQAYQATMTTPSQGLNFVVRTKGIHESRPKKNFTQLEMEARTDEDNYRYIIEIYDTGKANIRVHSIHRDPVSFEGYALPMDEAAN